MRDRTQLPYLLKLLDDDSVEIREAVSRELASFGPGLRRAVADLATTVDPATRARLEPLLARQEERPSLFPVPRQFAVGHLVRHRHYDYRAVVVAFDLCCQADDEWYQTNRTQPDRDQPWYHLLVDRSTMVTYAAQSNLAADTGNEPIRHPLVPVYFDGYRDRRHRRNDEPWSLP